MDTSEPSEKMDLGKEEMKQAAKSPEKTETDETEPNLFEWVAQTSFRFSLDVNLNRQFATAMNGESYDALFSVDEIHFVSLLRVARQL